ncbi:TetR/AcrR family transcriptional regulator C-terminal domain-containing protein [Halosaccharopolyspora lacisalsi]|nr:TetR/AcrR family transcriptional regulator C-terminal domain-containing protein [Halosaccharopolyspora lacisalsi]
MSPKRGGTGPHTPGAIWLRTRAPGRNTGSELSRERIADATVTVLDRDGMSGLSLRRLATTLNVHATTLYWHVATRDDLLDLALDAVFGEVVLPETHAHDWTHDITGYMHGLRTALLQHPWSGALASSRPLLGPNALARAEFVHAALASAGFTELDLTAAAAAISNYVIGTVATETSWQHVDETPARQALNEHLHHHAALYPTLATQPPPIDTTWEAHFTRGMTFLLAGLTAQLSRDQ